MHIIDKIKTINRMNILAAAIMHVLPPILSSCNEFVIAPSITTIYLIISLFTVNGFMILSHKRKLYVYL